jgi:hypothetical protein
MNQDERIAYDYLSDLARGRVEFEPDGNTPPDFLVKSETAVEVRRLNQQSFESGKPRGLEEVEIPLMKTINGVLSEFDSSHDGSSFFVFVRFQRPVPTKREVQTSLRRELEAFLSNSRSNIIYHQVLPNLEIDITPTPTDHGRPFLIGGNSDNERGGWVLSELEKNIQHCSDEKELKVAEYKNKYPIWWLVLIDHIGFGSKETENKITINHQWNKIILISPLNHKHAYEI